MQNSNFLEKYNGKNITVGIVIENDNNEVLFLKKRIDRINKEIYDIPTIKTDKLNKEEIFKILKEKYNIKIDNISTYINQMTYLDDICNKVLQINISVNTNNSKEIKGIEDVWEKVENIVNTDIIKDSLKETLYIYQYNKEIKK